MRHHVVSARRELKRSRGGHCAQHVAVCKSCGTLAGQHFFQKDAQAAGARHRDANAQQDAHSCTTTRVCLCGEPEDGGTFGWFDTADGTHCVACGRDIVT